MSSSLSPVTGLSRKIWEIIPENQNLALELSKQMNISPLAARLYAARGLTDIQSVENFTTPTLSGMHDPFLMRGMKEACDRIATAIRKKQSVAIFGDYDADGVTSTTVMMRLFQFFDLTPQHYLPHRLNEGYGINRRGIDHLVAKKVQLIVTVDNGITACDSVKYARDCGLDVVITDHHQPGETLPEALAIVDPNQPQCNYPFKELCGAGVAYKVAHGVLKTLGVESAKAQSFLYSLLEFVALGTIADIMPMLDENRLIVRHGLKQLAQTSSCGLKALIEMLGIDKESITSEMISFQIVPRLNAAGRMGDPIDALELLTTRDESRARELAHYLDKLNEDRRGIERDVCLEAEEIVDNDPQINQAQVLVVAGPDWHQGVLGIVASRLVSRYHRPAICMGIDDNMAKGSARSVGSVNLLEIIDCCGKWLEAYGGHKQAAGLEIKLENMTQFRQELSRVVSEKYQKEDFFARLVLDATATIDELNFDALEDIDHLQPFGQKNPTPLLLLKGCTFAASPNVVGSKHLKFRLKQKGTRCVLPAIWFNYPQDSHQSLLDAKQLEIAAEPRINTWNGRRTVEIMVRDIRICENLA